MATFKLNYYLQDNDGDKASFSRYIPDTWTFFQVQEFMRAYAPLVDPVTDGVISGMNFTVPVDISALTSNLAISVSDVEEIAAFQLRTTAGTLVKVNVPGMIEGMVGAGSDALNTSDPDAAALIGLFTGGVVTAGGTVAPCDVDENDIDTVVYARENFRASGRRR